MTDPIRAHLDHEGPLRIERLTSTPSTNAWLLDHLEREGTDEATLVVAEEQTAGRGQRGRIWISRALVANTPTPGTSSI